MFSVSLSSLGIFPGGGTMETPSPLASWASRGGYFPWFVMFEFVFI